MVETAPRTMHALAQRSVARVTWPSRIGRPSTARWNSKLDTHVYASASAVTVSPTQKI
jgi:hypothetical protein